MSREGYRPDEARAAQAPAPEASTPSPVNSRASESAPDAGRRGLIKGIAGAATLGVAAYVDHRFGGVLTNLAAASPVDGILAQAGGQAANNEAARGDAQTIRTLPIDVKTVEAAEALKNPVHVLMESVAIGETGVVDHKFAEQTKLAATKQGMGSTVETVSSFVESAFATAHDKNDIDAPVFVLRDPHTGREVRIQPLDGLEAHKQRYLAAREKYNNVPELTEELRESLSQSASGESVLRERVAAAANAEAGGFDMNGHHVPEPFATYWQTHGELAQQGLPITELYPEFNPTNKVQYPTQYFERARFEQHTENQPPYDVLLGLLGREQYFGKYPTGAPNQHRYSGSDGTVFPDSEGKYIVNPTFTEYWLTHGGLAQQGLPVSEEFDEVSPLDGKTYRVQYFERGRFELHPENKPPYNVLLGLLGVEQHGNPKESPPDPHPEAHFPESERTPSRKTGEQFSNGKSVNPGGWTDAAFGEVVGFNAAVDKEFGGKSGIMARIINVDIDNNQILLNIGNGHQITMPIDANTLIRLRLRDIYTGMKFEDTKAYGANIADLKPEDVLYAIPEIQDELKKTNGIFTKTFGIEGFK